MLQSLGGVDGAVVVDLFAGSGSFGIESLSRGAERVVFVERNRTALETLRSNIAHVGFEDRATVIGSSVSTAVSSLPAADIAFCDPPYADDPWHDLLGSLDAEILIGHAESPVTLTERWEEVRRRSYGKAHIVIARNYLGSKRSEAGGPTGTL